MLRPLAVLLLAAAFSFAATGCGSKTVTDTGANGQVTTRSVPNVHFAKTKFLLHTGVAIGAFHRYIYKPLKQGRFKSGASGRVKALAKAAASALFIFHELRQARDAALSSDTLRRHVVNPLDNLIAKIKALPSKLKGGSFNPADIIAADGAFSAVKGIAGQNGASITERSVPVPGT